MKKIIAMSMSLILLAGVITGCGKKEPGEKETLRRLENMYGECFEINGYKVSSLNRDLEFTYRYDFEGTPIWPDIDIKTGGKYVLYSDYRLAVWKYWNDEYRASIEKYNFAEVDYGEDGDDEDKCRPNLVYIFIDVDASPEELAKVESLMADLRNICREEDEFHDLGDYDDKISYIVNIWYIDDEAEEYERTAGIVIHSDTEDSKLRLENLKRTGMADSDPRKPPLDSGKAKVYVK